MTTNLEKYQKLNQIENPLEEKLSMKDNVLKSDGVISDKVINTAHYRHNEKKESIHIPLIPISQKLDNEQKDGLDEQAINSFKTKEERTDRIPTSFERQMSLNPNIKKLKDLEMLNQVKKSSSDNQVMKKNTKSLAQQRWDKLRTYTKGLTSFNKLNKNIQLFGTSEEVFDEKNAEKYLTKLKKIQGESDLNEQTPSQSVPWKEKIIECIPSVPVFCPDDTFVYFWNIMISLLMFYTAIIMPYNICFLDTEPKFFNIFDTVLDFIFLTDLVINCNMAYFDNENDLVKDRKKIFLNYLKSWFFIDLISSFPQTLIENKFLQNTDLLRLTRFSKLYRLSRVLRLLKVTKAFKKATVIQKVQEFFNINFGLSRLISFLFTTLILSHLCGCMWYTLPKLYDENDNWVVNSSLQDEESYRLYLFSLYWSFSTLFTVGFGDIHAYNKMEYVISIFWMLFGVGFYSFTIGTLSSILVNMDTRENILKYKLSILNDFAKETKLSSQLKEKIKKILIYNSQKNIFSWMDKQEIFNELPANLKCEIANSMREGFLKDITFFSNKDDAFVAMIVPFLQPLNFQEREPIYKKHDHPSAIYFITNGRVYFVNEEYIPFKIMIKGSYFGELEIVSDTKTVRAFSVIAAEKTDTLTLSKQNYENIVIREFPEIGNEIKNLAEIRKQRFSESEENLNRIFLIKRKTNIISSLKQEEPIEKKEEAVHSTELNNKGSLPNQVESNVVSSDQNILDTMHKANFQYNLGDRRDSIQVMEAKKRTAEEQVKFFEKKISETEKANKEDNLILVETESNMVNNGEEPLKKLSFSNFNNITTPKSQKLKSNKKETYTKIILPDTLENISEDSESESEDSSKSDSDNGDKKEVNDDSSTNSVENKLVDYSKAQKKMISKIEKLMDQFKFVTEK